MKAESGFKPYSLGIVVENKPRGSDIVLVTPIEELNIQPSGNIKEHSNNYSGNKRDLGDNSFNTEHSSKNYIRAKWVPYGESNRLSAPDVYANETIMIYKFANVDEYYWCDVMREPELRRLEDVMYAYSNIKSGTNAFDRNTSYWIRYNTRDKYIHLHTSNNDGEPFTYDLKIDTGTGIVSIKDNAGNSIELTSSSGNISLKCTNSINLEAGNSINLTAPTIKETCSAKTSTGSGVSVSMGSGVVSTQAVNGIVNNTPVVRNSGNVETAGSDRANPNLNAVP